MTVVDRYAMKIVFCNSVDYAVMVLKARFRTTVYVSWGRFFIHVKENVTLL